MTVSGNSGDGSKVLLMRLSRGNVPIALPPSATAGIGVMPVAAIYDSYVSKHDVVFFQRFNY
jgi:hypothetical protein